MKKRRIKWKLIGIMILVLTVNITFKMWEETKGGEVIETFFDPCRQPEDTLSRNEIEKDLACLKKTLEEVHPLAEGGLPEEIRESFEKYQYIEEMSVSEFSNKVNEILTTLKDSHTSVVPIKGAEGLPIESIIVDKGLYVIRARDLCKGDKIVKVGGMEIEELWKKMKTYRAAENKYWLQVQFEDTWTDKQFLDYSGVATIGGKVEVEVMRGEEIIKRNVHFSNYAYKYKPTRMNQSKGVVSYEIDEKKGVCSLIMTKCEYTPYYKEIIKQMFKEIRQKEIKYLAIDIRGNSGGNSMVMNEIIKYLPINYYRQGGGIRRLSEAAKKQRGYTSDKGRLGSKRVQIVKNNRYKENEYAGEMYVLVDRHTYSSAVMLATTFQDNKLAQVIGTPTGGKPHSYGDILQFQLPSSGIRYTISYTEWYRADRSKNTDEWLVPDYEIMYSLEDVMEKRDKGKEKLYEIIGIH